MHKCSRALREIVLLNGRASFKPMLRQALKQLVEKRLDQEMAAYLGVSGYERAADRHDYRNGHYVRHLLTEMRDQQHSRLRRRGASGHIMGVLFITWCRPR